MKNLKRVLVLFSLLFLLVAPTSAINEVSESKVKKLSINDPSLDLVYKNSNKKVILIDSSSFKQFDSSKFLIDGIDDETKSVRLDGKRLKINDGKVAIDLSRNNRTDTNKTKEVNYLKYGKVAIFANLYWDCAKGIVKNESTTGARLEIYTNSPNVDEEKTITVLPGHTRSLNFGIRGDGSSSSSPAYSLIVRNKGRSYGNDLYTYAKATLTLERADKSFCK